MSGVRVNIPAPDGDDYTVPMPTVKGGCLRCGVSADDVERVEVVVSPRGTAHFVTNDGYTRCGIDAAVPKWWWPL